MKPDSKLTSSPFELLELPDGRWCVAEFAVPSARNAAQSPAGFYATRDEAERAILRADPSPRDPRAQFAGWLRQS